MQPEPSAVQLDGAARTETTAHVLVRVWLPDRPGALGAVASRIGAIRGDIVGIDVLEQGDNVAVDEFAVDLPDLELVPMLVREVEQVDGASVEEVRVVRSFPDPRLDALESTALVCEASTARELWATLAVHVRREFLADWSAVVRGRSVLAVDGAAPEAATLEALAVGTGASPLVATGEAGAGDLAVAALPAHGAALLVGRDGHPFRRRERLQLQALIRIADRVGSLLPG